MQILVLMGEQEQGVIDFSVIFLIDVLPSWLSWCVYDVRAGVLTSSPEILLEGLNEETGVWHPIQFRYKPGDVHAMPSFVGKQTTGPV